MIRFGKHTRQHPVEDSGEADPPVVHPSGKDPRIKRRGRKLNRRGLWLRYSLLAVLILFAVSLYLIRRPPTVWREYAFLATDITEQEHLATVEAIIDRIEAHLKLDEQGSGIGFRPKRPGEGPSIDPDSAFADLSHEQIADIPIDQTTDIRLTNREVAAFTNQLYNDWINQRGFTPPDGLGKPLIVVTDGKLMFSFRYERSGWSQYFGGELKLEFPIDGMARGKVQNFTIGSLPVPLHEVGVVLRAEINAKTANNIGTWVRKLEDFQFRPTLELEHRRRARVTKITIHDDDSITLTIRVQDHKTYRQHNTHMAAGRFGPNDKLPDNLFEPGRGEKIEIVDVPTNTD